MTVNSLTSEFDSYRDNIVALNDTATHATIYFQGHMMMQFEMEPEELPRILHNYEGYTVLGAEALRAKLVTLHAVLPNNGKPDLKLVG